MASNSLIGFKSNVVIQIEDQNLHVKKTFEKNLLLKAWENITGNIKQCSTGHSRRKSSANAYNGPCSGQKYVQFFREIMTRKERTLMQ